MNYIRVYSPDGEPFDVPRNIADKVILQDGWTQQPFTKNEVVDTPQKEDEPELVLVFDDDEEDEDEDEDTE